MVPNDWFLQFLADLLDVPVERPKVAETTALGAAYLAGVQLGIFPSLETIGKYWQRDTLFTPGISPEERKELLRGWEKAISRVLDGNNPV